MVDTVSVRRSHENSGRLGTALRSSDDRKRPLRHMQPSCRKIASLACGTSVTRRIGALSLAPLNSLNQLSGHQRCSSTNAGGWIGDTIETVKPERLLDLVGASVLGTMFFSKAVVPAMKRQGGGFILNIASTSGLFSSRDSAAASTPKAAVRLFTHTFAREVAKYRSWVST